MQSSDELRNLIIQLYEKEASGGIFDFARQLYSRQEGVLVIGSEPGDRYEGYEAIISFYKTAGASGLEISIDELIAFSEGEFGWVVDCVTAMLPDGSDIPVRHTYVLHRVNDVWKIIHAHISVGIPDNQLGVILKH
jgi:ketosteroid isomerase-like protein